MKRYLVLLLILIMGGSIFGQDPHFSQYFTSPLTLNPAYTGFFEGPHRLAVNYRNQWLGAGEPFSTGTISFESRLLKGKLANKNVWGIGVMGIYDKTAGGAYNSNYVAISTAYHKELDEDGYQHLGIGFQGSFGSRILDLNRVSFNEQFSSRGFDLTLSNGESFITRRANYFDMNIGAMYNYHGPRERYYLGGSLYHITRPSMSFIGNEKYVLPMRFTVHGGASWLFGQHGELYLSGQYMQQAGASNMILGAAYGHSVFPDSDAVVVYAGLWWRDKDAIYPYLGYRWENFQFGLSYDMTISGLQYSSGRNKSFEISMVYEFLEKDEMKRLIPW